MLENLVASAVFCCTDVRVYLKVSFDDDVALKAQVNVRLCKAKVAEHAVDPNKHLGLAVDIHLQQRYKHQTIEIL